MKAYNHLLCYLFILLTVSCNLNTEQKAADSIKKAIEKFPQLKTTKKMFGNDYHLVKSVKNGKYDFEIQLFSEPDKIKGKQEILVIINSKKECCAIPFFSNKYKDYWNFPFDTLIPTVKKTNSDFTRELNEALTKLSIKEYSKKFKQENLYAEIMNELFCSVLNCRNIQERDSLLIYKRIGLNEDIPVEQWWSAFIRFRKNYELMKKEWHREKYDFNYNCFLDEKNNRIYQVNYYENSVDVRTYRQDCGYHMMRI
jgi:hypothetical protein